MKTLFKQGFEVYKSLTDDMKQALGLKAYADQLSYITQVFKDVNEYLDEKQKETVKKLNTAYEQSVDGLDKAYHVVSAIKEQAKTLARVLSSSVPEESRPKKMWDACRYFSRFAKQTEAKVSKAEQKLKEAGITLNQIGAEIDSIMSKLETVQENFVEEKRAEQQKKRAEAYGGAAAGIVGGFVGLVISYSIAAGVTEGMTIPQIEKRFKEQRDKISGYIAGFSKMSRDTATLAKQIDAKSHSGHYGVMIQLHFGFVINVIISGSVYSLVL